MLRALAEQSNAAAILATPETLIAAARAAAFADEAPAKAFAHFRPSSAAFGPRGNLPVAFIANGC